MPSQTVLVVDDEPSICWAFENMLTAEDHRVLIAPSAEEGLRLAMKHAPDLVVLDVRLPHQDGISTLPRFLEATNNSPVIVITAFGDLETAVAAVKNGATDYVTKPFKLDDILRVCRSALRKSADRASVTSASIKSMERSVLVGTSPAMQQVFKQIALVADSELSVLITGETGTGKELVAAAIHRHSARAAFPYVPIAPITLNPELIESELFGHIQGAFTGATENRTGLFEQAEGGTVLLDEIGELPLATQAKLLRVLEQGQYSRVGDLTLRRANVRIIAATNCDLSRAVSDGKFRDDLFHRLTGMQIHLPPLRQHAEDISALCNHFLSISNYNQAETAIDDLLLNELKSRPWHGNVRELRNAIEHATVLARGRVLAIDDFPPPKPGRESDMMATDMMLQDAVRIWANEKLHSDLEINPLHTQLLAATEPTLFEIVLNSTGGNRAKAAELLGLHRGTLRERLKAYRISE